jgi:serine protease Do
MDLTQAVNHEIEHIAQVIRDTMVRVESNGRRSGAGTVWHPEGLVLTNAHVASRHDLYILDAQGRRYPANVLAVDRDLDLAALSVQAANLSAIDLGSTAEMRAGDLVFAMGFPWGFPDGLTTGVLIGVESWPHHGMEEREWLMASLHLRPGHSGGPMVNAEGRLIGINTIMRGPDVGVAIPVETVKLFLKRRISGHQPAA